jgi:FeS assembly SUF system regulator
MIRLTRQSDYGIVLMSHLAARVAGSGSPDEQWSAPDLAHALEIPLPMVSKTLKLLARGGLLVSQRGSKGGYTLSRPAAEISVAAIVEALEGPIAITDCTDSTLAAHDCSRESICSVRDHWQVINQAVGRALSAISLADMVAPDLRLSQNLVPLGRQKPAALVSQV